MSEIKIRALKQKDRVALAAMIRKLVEKAGDTGLLNLIVHGEGTEKKNEQDKSIFTRLGINVIKMLLEVLESDVHEWFCDLIGKTKEEFLELPFDTEIKIIEQLVESKEAADFFSGALRLSSKMNGLAGRLQKEKAR